MRFAILALLLPFAGCDNTATVMTRGCYGSGCAIVNTSHYNPDFTGTGTLHTIKFPERKVTPQIDSTLDPDTAIRIVGDQAYILNQDSGTLRVYDLKSFVVVGEIPTGSAEAKNGTSFPHAFWPIGKKVYVTLSGNDAAHAVGVLDTTMPNAGVTKYITIAANSADTDGRPEAGAVHFCNGKLYVATGDYSVSGSKVTYAAGRIAVIDTATDAVTDIIQLKGQNPGAIAAIAGDCQDVLVAMGGQLTSEPDGTSGIEHVNLGTKTSAGFLLTDMAIAGRPTSVTVASSTVAFAPIYFDPQPMLGGGNILASTKVIAFNPSTGAQIGDVTGKAGNINFVAVSPDKKLYVGVGLFAGTMATDKLAEGLYVGAADGTKLSGMPIDLGQTPAAIAFE
jgi:DNA-binding beta-propeller fold protein YncE